MGHSLAHGSIITCHMGSSGQKNHYERALCTWLERAQRELSRDVHGTAKGHVVAKLCGFE